MNRMLFDEHGNRAQKLTIGNEHDSTPLAGWVFGRAVWFRHYHVLGFLPGRYWRPTFVAAKMSKGYRVFELDVGECIFVDLPMLDAFWQPAAPDHKRFPNIAALQMWVRIRAGMLR